jgi:UDP-N-acetylmuramate dehydrogenase
VCKHNYWGAENLSYIPGTVGASAIQNIGAYGVEAKDIIYSVDVLEISIGKKLTLTNKECKFAYRNSIFKEKEFENKYIVYSVTFKLLKHKKINLGYGNLKEKIQSVNNIKASDIRSLIINTRKAKLPETSELGSAGSFFKNPVIDKIQFEQIKKQYKNIPHFKQNDKYKIPAAWLIDKAGWKAKQIGNVSTYKNQALVIINATGNATGKEIACFANKIVNEVYQKFNIKLSPEVIYVE